MKNLRPDFLPLACALLALASSARAEALGWKRTTVEVVATARQEKAEAVFAFRNEGAQRVSITAVTASCDCVVPELAKKVFEPGESGELRAVIEIRGKVGRSEKTITVTTAENPAAPTLLTLRVDIPELVEIKPRLLVWQMGEAAAEKTVEIFLATRQPLALFEAKSDAPEMETRLETVVPHRQYRLIVKPASTTRPVRAAVSIKSRTGDSEDIQSVNVYAQVR